MRSALRIPCLAAAALLFVPAPALAADPVEAEVRATFDRFVAAQNAHDAPAVKELLWDGPGFLWITRGSVIWGREPAMRRFEANYAGTWTLEPDRAQLRVTVLDATTAQLFVPVVVTAGAPGQAPQPVPIHMNQVLVRTPSGWRIASILPIPVPKG